MKKFMIASVAALSLASSAMAGGTNEPEEDPFIAPPPQTGSLGGAAGVGIVAGLAALALLAAVAESDSSTDEDT
ncbi:hypothetical protein [Shimia biformata]|uniref:hypothetical protein n=1 Tax=Shimia biformata TaxID=1294299 RepID=UPI00194FA970|nr:hypothetical protein [Shimia biformata]